MFKIIFNKNTKEIVQVVEIKDGVTVGYSDNCDEITVEEKPQGHFLK